MLPVASIYDGPVVERVVAVAGRSIRLVRPSDPDRLLDRPDIQAWNLADEYMPYWAYLWPGAVLLAEAVANNHFDPGTACLELGCGLGLAGLTGVAVGLGVHFTDHDQTPLDFVARSARANGFDPALWSIGRLDWREPTAERYPLILGADITYEARLLPLVASVIAAMLADDGRALVTDPGREAGKAFAHVARGVGLTVESRFVAAESAELGPIRGVLHEVRRSG